jgi:hypothetical protein
MALWYRSPTRESKNHPMPIVPPHPAANEHPFHGWTENLHVSGLIRSTDRLSDALNRREEIRIDGPTVTPIGASTDESHTPPTMMFDPYDFELVVGTRADQRSIEERTARRIHKVRYPVRVVADRFEVRGILHVYPGNVPELITQRSSALFLPITQAVVRRGGRIVTGPTADVVLVSRHAIQKITQLDSIH